MNECQACQRIFKQMVSDFFASLWRNTSEVLFCMGRILRHFEVE